MMSLTTSEDAETITIFPIPRCSNTTSSASRLMSSMLSGLLAPALRFAIGAFRMVAPALSRTLLVPPLKRRQWGTPCRSTVRNYLKLPFFEVIFPLPRALVFLGATPNSGISQLGKRSCSGPTSTSWSWICVPLVYNHLMLMAAPSSTGIGLHWLFRSMLASGRRFTACARACLRPTCMCLFKAAARALRSLDVLKRVSMPRASSTLWWRPSSPMWMWGGVRLSFCSSHRYELEELMER